MDIHINYKKIGQHLRQARNDAQLTQAAVAEKLGIAVNTYSSMERGTQRPNLHRLIELCVLFGVNPSEVIYDCCDELVLKATPDISSAHKEQRELYLRICNCSDEIMQLLKAVVNAILSETENG